MGLREAVRQPTLRRKITLVTVAVNAPSPTRLAGGVVDHHNWSGRLGVNSRTRSGGHNLHDTRGGSGLESNPFRGCRERPGDTGCCRSWDVGDQQAATIPTTVLPGGFVGMAKVAAEALRMSGQVRNLPAVPRPAP